MAPRIERKPIAVPAVRIGKANSTQPRPKNGQTPKACATKREQKK